MVYVSISLATIERIFRIFRQAIYHSLVKEIEYLKLSGKRWMKHCLEVIIKEESVDGVQLSTKISFLAFIEGMELLSHFHQYLIENMKH
jgi:hypothetical protein